jgi:hypothetical protein
MANIDRFLRRNPRTPGSRTPSRTAARAVHRATADVLYPPQRRRADYQTGPSRVHCTAEPWPGIPIPMKGTHRTAAERQTDCSWAPLIAGLTPHGLRHGHQTAMRRDRVPRVLRRERLGTVPPATASRFAAGAAGHGGHDDLRDPLRALIGVGQAEHRSPAVAGQQPALDAWRDCNFNGSVALSVVTDRGVSRAGCGGAGERTRRGRTSVA